MKRQNVDAQKPHCSRRGKVTIEAFRRGFCAQVLLPSDAGYDSARRIWKASIDKHPGLIARCSDAAPLQINFAVQGKRGDCRN
jgi:hypothetical protein